MHNNEYDMEISYGSIDSAAWKNKLGEAAKNLQGRDHQHHHYLVFTKQGVLDLVQSSKLKKGMRKIPMEEIGRISQEIFEESGDRDIWRSYSVLLQARVNKWNSLPNCLGRMVALVFLMLASFTLFGIPLNRSFLRWQKGKEKELEELRKKIPAGIRDEISIENKQAEKIFPEATIPPNELEQVKENFTNKIKNSLETSEIIKIDPKHLDKDFKNEYEHKKNSEGLIEIKLLVQFNRDLLRGQRFSLEEDSSSIFFSEEIERTKEWVLNYICYSTENPLFKKLKEIQDQEEITKILNSKEMTKLLESERYLKVYKYMDKILEENEKHWLSILQGVANQLTLGTLHELSCAFLGENNFTGMLLRNESKDPINFTMLDRLPIQLKVVRDLNGGIEKIEGELTSLFAFVNGRTKEVLISKVIQIHFQYSVTLQDKTKEFHEKTNPILMTIHSIACQEVRRPSPSQITA